MLRIDTTDEPGTTIRFSLAGDVVADEVAVVRRLVDDAWRNGRDVVLDLDAVKLVDRDALAFFAAAEGRRLALVRCPPYVREWIRCHTRSAGR